MTAKVGSLNVDVTMETARFEQGLARAQGAMQRLAGQIGAQSKDIVAASARMGVSYQQFSGQVMALRDRVDPAGAALRAYKGEMDLLRQSLRLGAIDQQQFINASRAALASYRAQTVATKDLRAANGSMQSGMQQMSFQLNDIATQWASGTRPMQIFAQQSGQVVQSIQLMSNGAGKFGAFMAGPWGIAISAGVIVLGTLLSRVLDTNSAIQKLQSASTGLADVQGMVSDAFDDTTGRIKSNTGALEDNTRATIHNMKAHALKLRTDALKHREAFTGAVRAARQPSKLVALGAGMLGDPNIAQGVAEDARNSDIAKTLKRVEQGKLDPNVAWDTLVSANYDYAGITRDEALQALGDITSAQGKERTAKDITDSIAKGELQGSLRSLIKDAKKSRGGAANAAAKSTDDYLNAIDDLQVRRLQVEAEYTDSIEARYKATIAAIDADEAAYKRSVDHDKELGKAERADLIAKKAQAAASERMLAEQDHFRAIKQKEAELAQAGLRLQLDDAGIKQALARNSQEQLSAALEIFDLQERLRMAELDRIMAVEATASAAWQNARDEKASLQASAGTRRGLVERANASPGKRYLDDLKTSAAGAQDALERVQIDGLERLNDGLADTITGVRSLGDVFTDLADQVIADLTRIMVRKALIEPIANALFGVKSVGLGGAAGGRSRRPMVELRARPGLCQRHVRSAARSRSGWRARSRAGQIQRRRARLRQHGKPRHDGRTAGCGGDHPAQRILRRSCRWPRCAGSCADGGGR